MLGGSAETAWSLRGDLDSCVDATAPARWHVRRLPYARGARSSGCHLGANVSHAPTLQCDHVATPLSEGIIYSFDDYELDTRLRELRRNGEHLRVEPQVFDVLAYLFASRDRVVPKEELLDRVWGHRYVAPTT